MNDIGSIIDQGKITGLQISVFFICLLMNMLDGMDVMVIAYAAPSLSDAWSIAPGTLGTVFSAGLLGMTLGAMLLAPIADKIGRRRMILACVLAMGFGTLATAFTQTVAQLIALRILSGLGIGALLATAATMTAEYVPARYRNLIMSFVFAGYPLGAFLSGLVAASIIPTYGWTSIFVVAGFATLATFFLVWFILPESLEFLVKTRPPNGLKEINRILARMDQPVLETLPPAPTGEKIKRASVAALFAEERRSRTTWLWIAFFTAFSTLYFLATWIPKLASNTGLSLELAIYAGTVFNLGAFIGMISQGYFSHNFGLRKTICVFLIGTAVLMVLFGMWSKPVVILTMFGFIGFGLQGGFVGLYAVAARLYPTEIRNTGIGWGIGAGRLGAIIGPKVGGTLVGMGLTLTTNFMIFALPLVLSGLATLMVGKIDDSQPPGTE